MGSEEGSEQVREQDATYSMGGGNPKPRKQKARTIKRVETITLRVVSRSSTHTNVVEA